MLTGQRDAYGTLVRKYESRIRGLCLSLLGNITEADDASQDAFVKAYRRLSDFRGEAAFSTWIYRIAFRHCQDVLRSRARRRQESLDDLLEKHGAAFEKLMAAPQEHLGSDNADLIRRLLSSLPADYRDVLVLREVHGFRYDEIAQTLDCSVDAVKARLRRARNEVREKFRPLLEPPANT